MKNLFFLVACNMIFFVACATLPKYKPESIPAVYQPLFGVCAPADGFTRISYRKNNDSHSLGELSWNQPNLNNFSGEIVTQLGNSLFDVKISDGDKISRSGPLNESVPEISIDKENFILIDGHRMGLRSSEMGCILKGVLPRTWLNGISSMDRENGQISFSSRIESREVVVNINNLQRNCATVSWSSYLLFSQNVRWCTNFDERRLYKTSIYVQDIEIILEEINESN